MGERDVTTVEVKIDTWKRLNMRRQPGDGQVSVRKPIVCQTLQDGPYCLGLS